MANLSISAALLLASALGALPCGHACRAAASHAPQASPVTQTAAIPRIETLGGDWQEVARIGSMPGLSNRQGAAQATRNVLAVTNLSFPPMTMSGSTGDLQIDGTGLNALQSRWYPDHVLRKARSGDIEIRTAVCLPLNGEGLLYRVVAENQGTTAHTLKLTIHLTGSLAKHTRWGWEIPRDPTSGQTAQILDNGRSVAILETSGLCTSFSFVQKPQSLELQGSQGVAGWNLILRPGQTMVFNYAEAMGQDETTSHRAALGWADQFAGSFNQQERDWQAWFQAEFTPNNRFFSGSLPVLETSDARLRRVYYMSAVGILCACRTSFPIAPRVYVTASPQADGTMMYFWDTREFATTLALLDPAMLKRYLEGWLARGIYGGYSEEFLTGSLQGPWYSANDVSVFILLNTYVNVTGDRAFLSEKISDKTVLKHMADIATHWKQLVRPGRTLADYGGAWNLLECVPTYINEVPSFNAANVSMMRRTATIEAAEGDAAGAAALRADAAALLPAVLALYEPGQGVWDSIHQDGTRVQMRHVFDFVTVGQSIPNDLTPAMRQQMVGFVERELLTDHWMRAQSLTDPAAAASDRPDHGPMGAYAAWPAETIGTLVGFGDYDKALDFMHRLAAVTYEGPFSQAHELLGKTHDAPVRIAERGGQTFYESGGISLAETTIRSFFGYQPDLFGKGILHDTHPRGFSGKLLNVRQGTRYYDIVSSPQGLAIRPR